MADEDEDDDDEDEDAADIRAAEDDDDDDEEEAEAADDFCDDDNADCVDADVDWACDFVAPAAADNVDDCVVATLSLIVAMVGPGGPTITCMGCGGGESGQVGEKRLMGVTPLLVTIGGGDNGISMMGLGERAGTKSDWALER